jgi:hypothetical protein
MTTLIRRTRRSLAIAFATTAALAACSGASSTAPTVFGTYALQTINGQSLPISHFENMITVTLVSGTLVLGSDQKYTAAFNSLGTIGVTTTPSTDRSNGIFSISGSTITFVTDGVTEVGTINGNTVSLTSGGDAYVWKR